MIFAPFLASDVTSYLSTCLDQSLTCSLVEHGLKLNLISDLEEKQKKYAVEDYLLCAQNISSAFAGKKILLKELNTNNTKVLFSRNDTTITLESPAKVEIGKSTKIIGSLATLVCMVPYLQATQFHQALISCSCCLR